MIVDQAVAVAKKIYNWCKCREHLLKDVNQSTNSVWISPMIDVNVGIDAIGIGYLCT